MYVHIGTYILPLEFAYCALYVCACEISFCIAVLSAKLTKATTKVHTGMSSTYLHSFFIWGFTPDQKSMLNKWKNYFSKMKGDIGKSCHEKEGEQEDA